MKFEILLETVDFGAAVVASEGTEKAIFQGVRGTIIFCPPEAIRETKQFPPWKMNRRYRAMPGEIWAMGCLLYKLLHGFVPFKSVNDIRDDSELYIDEE